MQHQPSATTKFEQSTNCAASDATLTELRNIVCVSFAMGECCGEPVPHNVTAAGDWPNQAIYMDNLLQTLVNTEVDCLGTAVSRSTVEWLSDTSSVTSVWWNTWVVFQVQYYDMPRKPGARIESPATLGRKCWAFDYLKWIWDQGLADALQRVTAAAKLNLTGFSAAWDAAVPLTMGLCSKVMANCFENSTFTPSRNGSCPTDVGQFYVGFQWENGQRDFELTYPFPRSPAMTRAWSTDVDFAVGTAVNYII